MDIITEFFKGMDRQGPGGDEQTRTALSLIRHLLPRETRAADIGCGTGRQTAVLASEPGVSVTAVDLLPEMVEGMKERMRRLGLQDRVNPDKPSNLRAATAEEALLSAMLRYPELAQLAADLLTPDDFVTAFNRRVFQTLAKKLSSGAELSLSAVSADLSEDELSSVARMMARYHDVPASERDVREYIQVLKSERAALRARQTAAESQPQELLSYLESLRNQKK